VVWLDDLQRYLEDLSQQFTGAAARAMIGAGMLLVGTMWPEEYENGISLRVPGQVDMQANAREVLRLAHVISLSAQFSRNELMRAQELCSDHRIQMALDALEIGIPQVLAGGPEIVRRWENAPADQCCGKAIISAALDARLVGARAALSVSFLRSAAPAYLTPAQRAVAPVDWFESALDYATVRVHGAAAALSPVSGGMGSVVGYKVADYLFQHAGRTRRSADMPAGARRAVIEHRDSSDSRHLANFAYLDNRLDDAETLFRGMVESGEYTAVTHLYVILMQQGRIEDANVLMNEVNQDQITAAWGKWNRRIERMSERLDGLTERLRTLGGQINKLKKDATSGRNREVISGELEEKMENLDRYAGELGGIIGELTGRDVEIRNTEDLLRKQSFEMSVVEKMKRVLSVQESELKKIQETLSEDPDSPPGE
jgi:hypothetical protein